MEQKTGIGPMSSEGTENQRKVPGAALAGPELADYTALAAAVLRPAGWLIAATLRTKPMLATITFRLRA